MENEIELTGDLFSVVAQVLLEYSRDFDGGHFQLVSVDEDGTFVYNHINSEGLSQTFKARWSMESGTLAISMIGQTLLELNAAEDGLYPPDQTFIEGINDENLYPAGIEFKDSPEGENDDEILMPNL